MKRLFLLAASPSLLLADLVNLPRETRWAPHRVASDFPTLSAVPAPPIQPGTYPFPKNYRDPNTAWNGSDKAVFFTIFVLTYVLMCAIVAFRKPLKRILDPALKVFRPSPLRTRQPGAEALLENAVATETNTGPDVDYPKEKGVHQLFEARCKETPDAVALVIPQGALGDDGPRQEIKYAALDRMTLELAKGLASVDAHRGTIVALLLQRSVGQVVALFGALRTGATVLPVDNEAPDARKQFVLLESLPGVLVGQTGDTMTANFATQMSQMPILKDLSFATVGADGSFGGIQLCGQSAPKELWPPQASVPSDRALIIYTSGTSGTPKGIEYSQQFLTHSVFFFGHLTGMDVNAVALLKSPYYWGAMIWDYFPALTRGGMLVVASATGHKNPEYLCKTIKEERVTVLMITPSVLDLVHQIHAGQRSVNPLKTVKHIVTVGEPLSSELANRVANTQGLGALHNAYAATETSTCVYHVPPNGINLELFPNKVPVGLPEAHSQVYIMSVEEGTGQLIPVPTGANGEICFGGALAIGYFKRDDLTRQKFVMTEKYGRLYRTGDMGRWKNGVVEVLGRNDRQVKVRGVRIEPEEVEIVLRRFMVPQESLGDPELGAAGIGEDESYALSNVVIVGTPEPTELVTFATLRPGVTGVTPEMLKAHCAAHFTSGYVPKFFVIADEIPSLASGKPDFAKLREMAAKHAEEEGQVVMDSLGQMKKLSAWAILENQVIHRCYAFWMLGVVVDHWNRCALEVDPQTGRYLALCTTIAQTSVKPWTEILIRSFGNDQTMFGFIMLGAYQDSRPAKQGAKSRVNLRLTDLFIFLVYLAMALPIPQILHYMFLDWAWPHTWKGHVDPGWNMWGVDYMQLNSYTSDHRWYLLMVLKARIYMQIMEWLRVPGWLATIICAIPCFIPGSVFIAQSGGEYLWDFCPEGAAPVGVQYMMAWIFRSFGNNCPIYQCWEHWYTSMYVLSFHFLRPGVNYLSKSRYMLKGATWGAVALSLSNIIGVMMAEFHYPNTSLESGKLTAYAPLEIGMDFLQPALFIFAMAYFPFDLAWWGNTTLGCYCFHFYFKGQMSIAISSITDKLSWDPTGLLTYFVIIGICGFFCSVIGPLGHYLLLSPALLAQRLKRFRRNAGRSSGTSEKS